MERGQLVPDDITIRMLGARLAQVDAARGVILDGFPRNRAQAVSLDAPLAERGQPGRSRPRRSTCRRRSSSAALRPLGLPVGGPRLQRARRTRRASPGAATSTARRSSSARMTAPRPSGPGSRPARRAPRGRVALPRGQGSCARSTAGRRSTTSPPTSSRPSTTCSRRPDDGHPQVARRDREDAPRRPDRRPRSSPSSRRRSSRASPRPSSTALAEAHIRKSGATPSFKGYPGINPKPPVPGEHLHLDRRRDRPRHPGRADHPRRARSCPIDAGAIVDGWHGDAARTFYVGDAAGGRGRPHRDDPARRCSPASPRRVPATTSRTSRPRSRTSPRPRATASSASSSATGSAPRCTRSRRSRTSGRVARGASWNPACAWRSSRCSRSAGRGARPRRRLDGRRPGRIAGRPFRGLDRDHRGRTRGPDRAVSAVAGIAHL